MEVRGFEGVRRVVRNAIESGSGGSQAQINFDSIAANLYPTGFEHGWQTVPCIENHDIVKVGTDQRIPFLADPSNRRAWYNYSVGFPSPGHWAEVFNSDVYDNWVNPIVAGNAGGISASGPAMHGFQASASIVIPANGFAVFAPA